MTQLSATPARRRWLRYGALAAVVLIPLAFAGLFVGAVSQVNNGDTNIPAAIVDNDQLVTQTAADGTESQILAGRQLVTELTGKNSAGFDWTITNSKDAAAALKAGTVYAVLTVPKNFSKSIVSLSSKSPVKANIQITTDDAHNYLTGSVAQVVGDSLTSTFGKAITQQYIAGVTGGLGGVSDSLTEAGNGAGKLGDGASSLADGASSLSSGLSKLAGGISKTQAGASTLSSGLGDYVAGVSQVPSGLRDFQAGIQSAKKQIVSQAVTPYTSGISKLSKAMTAAVAQLAADPTDPVALGTVQVLTANLAAAAGGGSGVVGGVNATFDALSASAGTFATKTDALASGGTQLVSGTSTLASGLGTLASGASASATGATKLATGADKIASGADKLSTGLISGAKSAPSYTKAETATISKVVSDPIGANVVRHNEVSSVGQIISTLFVPLGLWIGALAVFLVMPPITRRTLSSTAASSRLVLSAIGRASIITVAQALTLVALLHIVVGVSWSLLPATIGISVLMALAFTAFHYLLTIGLGRAGLIVSIVLLALQITSTGGLYPIELLAAPFQFVSPLLPLTYGVAGIQAIISGAPASSALLAAGGLAVFGVLSLLVALIAVRRVRRAKALGLVPAAV